MSVVRIRESPYYRGFFFSFKKIYENFVGTLETVRNIGREIKPPSWGRIRVTSNSLTIAS